MTSVKIVSRNSANFIYFIFYGSKNFSKKTKKNQIIALKFLYIVNRKLCM